MTKMERHAANFKQLWFTTAPGIFGPHWFASKKPGYKTWFEKLKLDFETPLMDFCNNRSSSTCTLMPNSVSSLLTKNFAAILEQGYKDNGGCEETPYLNGKGWRKDFQKHSSGSSKSCLQTRLSKNRNLIHLIHSKISVCVFMDQMARNIQSMTDTDGSEVKDKVDPIALVLSLQILFEFIPFVDLIGDGAEENQKDFFFAYAKQHEKELMSNIDAIVVERQNIIVERTESFVNDQKGTQILEEGMYGLKTSDHPIASCAGGQNLSKKEEKKLARKIYRKQKKHNEVETRNQHHDEEGQIKDMTHKIDVSNKKIDGDQGNELTRMEKIFLGLEDAIEYNSRETNRLDEIQEEKQYDRGLSCYRQKLELVLRSMDLNEACFFSLVFRHSGKKLKSYSLLWASYIVTETLLESWIDDLSSVLEINPHETYNGDIFTHTTQLTKRIEKVQNTEIRNEKENLQRYKQVLEFILKFHLETEEAIRAIRVNKYLSEVFENHRPNLYPNHVDKQMIDSSPKTRGSMSFDELQQMHSRYANHSSVRYIDKKCIRYSDDFLPDFPLTHERRFELKEHVLVKEMRSKLQTNEEYNIFSNNKVNFVISLSGGVDSIVHSCILKILEDEFKGNWCALHLRHSNRAETVEEEKWVGYMCNRMGINLYTYNIELQRPHGDVYTGIDREEYEDITRYIRFKMYDRCFENMEKMSSGENISFKRFAVIGHHEDDVDENRLAELGKGNLIYINGVKPWVLLRHHIPGKFNTDNPTHELMLHRPLLECRKFELFDYAEARKLVYMRDSTPYWSRRGWIRRTLDGTIDQEINKEKFSNWENLFHVKLLEKLVRYGKPYKFFDQKVNSCCDEDEYELNEDCKVAKFSATDNISLDLEHMAIGSSEKNITNSTSQVNLNCYLLSLLSKLGALSDQVGTRLDEVVQDWKTSCIQELDLQNEEVKKNPTLCLHLTQIFSLVTEFETVFCELKDLAKHVADIWNPLIHSYQDQFQNESCPLQLIPDFTDIQPGPFLFTRAFYAAQTHPLFVKAVTKSLGYAGACKLGKKSLVNCYKSCLKTSHGARLHQNCGYIFSKPDQKIYIRFGSKAELLEFHSEKQDFFKQQ